jgi:homoserine kinase
MVMDSPWKSAFAPATVANVGPGLDVLGLALDANIGLGDTSHLRLAPPGHFQFTVEQADGSVPAEPSQNAAYVAAKRVFELAGVSHGMELRLEKGIRVCSGLGSSAASSASAALAANRALGSPLSMGQLIQAARAGEVVAAGVPHADNVAPALMGGIVLMVDVPDSEEDGDTLRIVQLPTPRRLHVSVALPDIRVRTKDARSVLPDEVPRQDAIANMGCLGLLVSALYDEDYDRLRDCIADRLHQPYRKHLVPHFDSVRRAALDAGALGGGLSGSGPTMFALSDDLDIARASGLAMASVFESHGVQCWWAAGPVSQPGINDVQDA